MPPKPPAATHKQLAAVQTLTEQLQENHDDICVAAFSGTRPATAVALFRANRDLLKQLNRVAETLPG
eukprot:1597738-Rhodomonas_salina.1